MPGTVYTLRSISLQGFRAFGESLFLENLDNLTLIAGPNNVGKSSVLMPLRRLTRLDPKFIPDRGSPDGFAFLGSDHSAIFNWYDYRGNESACISLWIESSPENVELVLTGSRNRWGMHIDLRQPKEPEASTREESHSEALEFARNFAKQIVYVPVRRSITSALHLSSTSEHEERLYDGTSLLHDLLSWHLPDPNTGRPPDRDQAEQFNQELSRALGTKVCVWPTLSQGIQIALGNEPGRRFEDMGQGVTQIATIVAAILSISGPPILLLEEPENCLHPGLQRNLISYLTEQDGQFLITTHSNHLIDAAHGKSKLCLLTCNPHSGKRSAVSIPSTFMQAIHELGVSASSIASTAAVVWIEGPTDAMYLRHWLSRHNIGKTLCEGRDFTFAFHGGSLLAHHGPGEEIVKIWKVHPGSFLIADSDRRASEAPLAHPYLQRIMESLSLADRSWITAPKEIEGYLPDAAIGESAAAVRTTGFETLSERLKLLGASSSLAERKVELAKHALARLKTMSDEEILNVHDLSEQMSKLICFIQACREQLPPVI